MSISKKRAFALCLDNGHVDYGHASSVSEALAFFRLTGSRLGVAPVAVIQSDDVVRTNPGGWVFAVAPGIEAAAPAGDQWLVLRADGGQEFIAARTIFEAARMAGAARGRAKVCGLIPCEALLRPGNAGLLGKNPFAILASGQSAGGRA